MVGGNGRVAPFFAVGHGRSGTTWLERILNTHPEVLCKGSGMWFGRNINLYEGRKTLYAALAGSETLRTWHGMQPNYWSTASFEEDVPGMVRAVIDHVMRTELAASGKRIAGDRTPHYVSNLDEIHTLYPEAKIIHIIRDGRDVAVSNLHAVWNSSRDRGGPVDLNPEDLERRDAYFKDRRKHLDEGRSIFARQRMNQLASSWNDVVRRGREDGEGLFGGNYLEVRYESLLEDPRPELARLFGFLEVGREKGVVERVAEENSFERRTSGRQRGEEDSTSFFRKGIHGDWKNVFNERDRDIFKRNAGELLVELGYEGGMNW
jgi:hypothetical protein